MRFSRFILKYILLIFLVLGNPLRGGSCTEGVTNYKVNVSYCQWTCGETDCCAYWARDFDGDGWGWQPDGYHCADEVTIWNSGSNDYDLVLKSGDKDLGSCNCSFNLLFEYLLV